jgi:hypothetical protein
MSSVPDAGGAAVAAEAGEALAVPCWPESLHADSSSPAGAAAREDRTVLRDKVMRITRFVFRLCTVTAYKSESRGQLRH